MPIPDLDALQRDAEEYLALYRKLSGLSGATWARGPYRYHAARERWDREQLLQSLRALRTDKFGAQLGIDATLAEANIQKGLLLSQKRTPPRPTDKPDWSMPTAQQTRSAVRESMRAPGSRSTPEDKD